MVIGIDQEGVVPSAESLPAGDNAQFLILFDQSAYVADISEFSTDQFGDVMLSLVPGTDNLLQIGISSALPAGAEFSVFWRDQPIINVTIADVLRILSVNGSTHLPLSIDAASGEAVKFDIEFSHEYEPTVDDFIVEPASAGTMAKGSDGLWAFTPNASAVGSDVNIFCIEQWISKVEVLGEPIHVSPRIMTDGSKSYTLESDIWDKFSGVPGSLFGSQLTFNYNGVQKTSVGSEYSSGSCRFLVDSGYGGRNVYISEDSFYATFYGPASMQFELLSIEVAGVKHRFIDY